MITLLASPFSFPVVQNLQESPFAFGLSPFWSVAVILLLVFVLWWLLSYQGSREDLHQTATHDHDDHPPTSHRPEASPPAAAAPAQPDDLKKLEGIGPKVAGLLNQAGILTFAQLAETPVSRLQDILESAGYRYMDPTSWPQQAALAAAGDWEGLHKLQDELSGGRHVS